MIQARSKFPASKKAESKATYQEQTDAKNNRETATSTAKVVASRLAQPTPLSAVHGQAQTDAKNKRETATSTSKVVASRLAQPTPLSAVHGQAQTDAKNKRETATSTAKVVASRLAQPTPLSAVHGQAQTDAKNKRETATSTAKVVASRLAQPTPLSAVHGQAQTDAKNKRETATSTAKVVASRLAQPTPLSAVHGQAQTDAKNKRETATSTAKVVASRLAQPTPLSAVHGQAQTDAKNKRETATSTAKVVVSRLAQPTPLSAVHGQAQTGAKNKRETATSTTKCVASLTVRPSLQSALVAQGRTAVHAAGMRTTSTTRRAVPVTGNRLTSSFQIPTLSSERIASTATASGSLSACAEAWGERNRQKKRDDAASLPIDLVYNERVSSSPLRYFNSKADPPKTYHSYDPVSRDTHEKKTALKVKLGHIAHKFVTSIATFVTTLVACSPFPRHHNHPTIDIEIQDLSNELILLIISKCDFSSKMNLRAVNRRFHCIVDECAHKLVRGNIVGGVEIGHSNSPDQNVPIEANMLCLSTSIPTHQPHLTLRRPLKRLEILLPAYRLTNILRHVCVCHSLKLRGVLLDETLASDILDASFRAISDLIVDRVHTVTAETMCKLVKKVYPSNSLHIFNHSSVESGQAVSSDVINSCPARNITIESGVRLMHDSFDDEALVQLVLADLTVRRSIRLPHCAVTHNGINNAALAFHKYCCDVMEESTAEMLMPILEIFVALPRSVLIDRSLVVIPAHMKDHCAIWGHVHPHHDSFTLEVRVDLMNLRILVDARS